ncbi:response regulator transcription factor [Thiohalocapsa marina]|uniref:Response regulator transcription factor n=1 Tax=Thiohalocapsa marina TaxID=424902 RepID=A0A5M8FF08_9GAMM|nr:response regulator transcription factor [Thiohalocapsa marina]KAA6182296.1 response regulator transcription factor [Thiohalocapsa marina]
MSRITLLEDEPTLCDEMAAFLRKRGHAVQQAWRLADFWPLMAQTGIAIIDVMLPDGSGFEAVQQLRALSPRAGIIVLTARGSLDDKLTGLGGGADHYLLKPIKLLELAAVIDSLARRLGEGWRLDAQRHELASPSGSVIALSAAELVFLRTLARARGASVSRRSLIEALGHDWLTYDERRLEQLVSRLRRRCEEGVDQPLPVKTERGKGYSLTESMQAV